MTPSSFLTGLDRLDRGGPRLGRRGVAALEFALTLPALVFLLFGMYDLSMGWITWRRLETSATAVGQIASMMAAQPDTSNWLTTEQAQLAAGAINAAMPETRAGGAQYAVALSEISFATNQSCGQGPDGTASYCVATVLWSKLVLSNGSTTLSSRPCGQQARLANTAPPSQAGMPDSTFQANPTLVVDVAYTFTPLFLSSLFGNFPMRWVAYFPSRFGSKADRSDQTMGYGEIDGSGNKTPDTTGAYCP